MTKLNIYLIIICEFNNCTIKMNYLIIILIT